MKNPRKSLVYRDFFVFTFLFSGETGNGYFPHIFLIYSPLPLWFYPGTPNNLPHRFVTQIYPFALIFCANIRNIILLSKPYDTN